MPGRDTFTQPLWSCPTPTRFYRFSAVRTSGLLASGLPFSPVPPHIPLGLPPATPERSQSLKRGNKEGHFSEQLGVERDHFLDDPHAMLDRELHVVGGRGVVEPRRIVGHADEGR